MWDILHVMGGVDELLPNLGTLHVVENTSSLSRQDKRQREIETVQNTHIALHDTRVLIVALVSRCRLITTKELSFPGIDTFMVDCKSVQVLVARQSQNHLI